MVRKDTELLRSRIGASQQHLEDFLWNAAEEFYA
jgi:hypothetical protein